MSSDTKREAEIISTEEVYKDKFLKMEMINWRDEDGKEVRLPLFCSPRDSQGSELKEHSEADGLQRKWECANRSTRTEGGVDC